MTDNFTILAGTTGNGLWRSRDGGETWGWGQGSLTFLDVHVYGIAVHPLDPAVVYIGTDTGLHRSIDRGGMFESVEGPMTGGDVWRIAFDPVDPDTILVGTRPGHIHRTRDAGKSWETLPADIAETGEPAGKTRLTGLQVDPDDREQIWGCIEVDGARRSRDGGATWTHELVDFTRDFHWLSILPGAPKRIFFTTPGYVVRSDDGGESFEKVDIPTPYPSPYFREMYVKPDDPSVLLLGVGEHVFGATGIGAALDRPGRDLGHGGYAERTQLADLGLRIPSLEPRSGRGLLPLRRALHFRGRRALVAQARPRAHRRPDRRLASELNARCKSNRPAHVVVG